MVRRAEKKCTKAQSGSRQRPRSSHQAKRRRPSSSTADSPPSKVCPANEEIMSVNEELQSTNEELETSKEELQSLNEELSTVNSQLEGKVRELEQTNNDLDNLLKSTNLATIFLDRQLRIRRFTPAATELFRLIPSDLRRPLSDIAQNFTDESLLPDAGRVLDKLTPAKQEIQTHDGKWFMRETRPYRTHDDRIEGVVITFSDVASDVVQEARLRAEKIVDTVRDALLVLDSSLRVKSTNRAFHEMFQVSPEETEGQLVYDLGNRQWDIPKLHTLLNRVLKRGQQVDDFEVTHDFERIGRRIMLLNARLILQDDKRPRLILLAIKDVTMERDQLEALRERESLLQSIVNTAADGVLTINQLGRVLSFNPAAEKIFGYTAEEVVGENVKMLMPAPEGMRHDKYLKRYMTTGVGKIIGSRREVVGRRRDGSTFPLDLAISEFQDGPVRKFTGVVRDLSDVKQALRESAERQAELNHVLRVSTISELASGLAHELNQPLTAVANDVATSLNYMKSDRRRATAIKTLEHAAREIQRAGRIVHNVRDFIQKNETRLEDVDLRDVVRSATSLLAVEIERHGIAIQVDIPGRALPIHADDTQIEQVLVNLLQNAVDAIGEAGGKRKQIRVGVGRGAGGMAEVAVHDTGSGLTREAAARVFSSFFTTKKKGLGMGLAISRSIVDVHGGRIEIGRRTDRGRGTTARFALPLRRQGSRRKASR
jgi:two-component system CheB/CheR fusion protein